ncbi:MAG: hypothetical protein AAB490_05660 [Patescibacteria group bacterium]
MTEQVQLLPEDVPDSVIQEIVKELSAIGDQNAVINCACAGHRTTVRAMITAVQQRTPKGMELIRAHLELQKRLEELRKEKPWWKFW